MRLALLSKEEEVSVAQPSQVSWREDSSIMEMGGPSGELVRSGWKAARVMGFAEVLSPV